ncbi:MAG: lycopene cyclase [Saprospiraceae bacterium]|nr:lycopene cyclase [Saprospiraceae bacterium]
MTDNSRPNLDNYSQGLLVRERMAENQTVYDVIIAGAGMAGLSLLWQIRQSGLNHLQILVLDPDEKKVNDRTWSFWETEPGPFEHLVYRSWKEVRVTSAEGTVLDIPLGDYRYKTIRGIDLYRFMDRQIAEDPQTWRLTTTVLGVESRQNEVSVQTEDGAYRGKILFDSTYRLPLTDPQATHLLQHFLGYVIRTPRPAFHPERPDLMNFQVPETGDCRFMYILPFSETEALVEYTLFTEKLLEESAYADVLKDWIATHLGLTDFEILEREFGVIPMSDEPVNEFPFPHVIRIGTAGGYTNPSTGYTFRSTQKRIAQIVDQFSKTGQWRPTGPVRQARFDFYASVLLGVLAQRRTKASRVFWTLYTRNPIDRIFRFLDGESQIQEEARIMSSAPWFPFTASGWNVMVNTIKRHMPFL